MLRRTILVLVPLALSAQMAERIQRVESGLGPRLRIAGRPESHWSIKERMAHYRVPAVSAAVIQDGKIVWSKAWGMADAEGKRVANVDTVFQAASISKLVASMAVLSLVAQGRLSLDEDVNVKFKSWKLPAHSFSKPVTLRGILSHSAGLTVHGFPGYAAGAPVPTLLQLLKGEKPANTAAVVVDIAPGSRWRYSGGGYEVMQMLVQDVTGIPFARLVKKLVLDPVDMRHSTYEQPLQDKWSANAAHAYNGNGEPIAGRWHTYPEQAAAGLWTTPTDLARLLLEVQKLAASRSKLLPGHIVKDMLTAQKGMHGLGWQVTPDGPNQRFQHGGSNAGFRCNAVAYTSRGQGAVIMTNADSGASLAGEVLRSIAAEYGWPDYRPETRNAIDLTAQQLEPYAGEYKVGEMVIRLSVTAGGLRAAAPWGTAELAPESETRFLSLTDGVPDFVFERDGSGRVTAFSAGNLKAAKAP